MKNIYFAFFGLVVIFGFMTGCQESTAPESSASAETGFLKLSLDMADAPPEVDAVRGYFSRTDFDTIRFDLMIDGMTASNLVENVPVGTWNCRIEALNADNEVIYFGETQVTVRASETTNIDMTLNPVGGNIQIHVRWGEEPAQSDTVFLIIDEDGLDNGLHFNAAGGPITPSGPDFFAAADVNDNLAGETQRRVLRYFSDNIGRTITVKSGQTGDEGWFAPNCIPAKWIPSSDAEDSTCLEGSDRRTAIRNYLGLSGEEAVPGQERLDNIPDVRPLRAYGLNMLTGKTVYAVVYDNDISINYDLGDPLGVNGNLQGETLGTVVFRVNEMRTLDDFSSSTLPEVQITILDASVPENRKFMLLDAPVPAGSSVPNDRIAPGSLDGYYSPGN